MESLFKCHFSVTSALTIRYKMATLPSCWHSHSSSSCSFSPEHLHGLTCYVIYLCPALGKRLQMQSIQSVREKCQHLVDTSNQCIICSVKVKLNNADRAPKI